MNEAAQAYWESYWKGKEKPEVPVSAWAFGTTPDQLALLVIDGRKTATCSAHPAYEVDNEPIPEVGEYSIILNGKDEPVAIIQTTEVEIVPFNEVTEDFAKAEGEGDLSYQYWWEVHQQFFKEEANELGFDYSEDMDVVCERFHLVHVKKTDERTEG